MASIARKVPASLSPSLIVSLPIASLTHPSKPIERPVFRSKTAIPGLDESGFQQHLEAVLEVEQHLSRPSVIMWRVERLGRFDQRRHRLALQHARFLPQPHRLTRAAQRLAIAQPAFRAAAADRRIRSPRPPEASHYLRNIPRDA